MVVVLLSFLFSRSFKIDVLTLLKIMRKQKGE